MSIQLAAGSTPEAVLYAVAAAAAVLAVYFLTRGRS